MRKVILAGSHGARLPLAVPASASFDRHFTVLEKARFHLLSNEQAFTIRGGLRSTEYDNRVGSDRGRCKIRPHEVLRCRGISPQR